MFLISFETVGIVLYPFVDFGPQGRAAGGFSPVCLTSRSVVIVVVPPGVLISVSVFEDDFSAHPIMLSENRLSISAAQIMRFMGNISYSRVLDAMPCFNTKPALAPCFVFVYDFTATLGSNVIPALIRECSSKAFPAFVMLRTARPQAFANATPRSCSCTRMSRMCSATAYSPCGLSDLLCHSRFDFLGVVHGILPWRL